MEAQALALFRASEVEYREGRFKSAVEKLRAARELVSKPVLTYNLARAYEGLGELVRAADEYERYLAEAGNPKDAGAIRTRIVGIRHTLDQQRESDERRVAAEKATKRAEEERLIAQAESARMEREQGRPGIDRGPSRAVRIAAWSLAGAGAATLLAGAAFGGLAKHDHDATQSLSGSQVAALSADDSSRRYSLAANIALPLGATIAIGGAVWGTVMELRHRRAERRLRSATVESVATR